MEDTASRPRIAIIGTGGMGAGIAHNLLNAGYDLTVCNRTKAKAQPLIDAGAGFARTPRQAAAGCDVIISIVGNNQDSRDVWLGPDGVLTGQPRSGAIAIESTTLSYDWVRHLESALTAEGMRFIDCPVTGGRDGALRGALTLLVGAADEDLAAARPVMNVYSEKIIHFGLPGTATAYKLMVNLMVGAQAVALAEGLLLAEQSGLNMARVIEALSTSAVASPVVKAYAQRMVSGDHEENIGFLARWMFKDMTYALELAADRGQAVPTSTSASQVFRMAEVKGLLDQNVTAVIEALRSTEEAQ